MEGAKVMVVEDDLDLRAVLLRGLQEEGFAAVGAGTGAELLARIEPEAPDALIVDIGLPDTDGRDVCQALRAQGRTRGSSGTAAPRGGGAIWCAPAGRTVRASVTTRSTRTLPACGASSASC